jgi:eukaryotic-like serine/threonine-protein kinase
MVATADPAIGSGDCSHCPGGQRILVACGQPTGNVSVTAHALPSRELVLDRYRPLRPLGSGASGSVWLARDESNGLDVALKIVPREGKAGDRAEREAEAAARLRHERCLRAYGFGSDSGHVYIAYEYVGGRTLREALRAGELPDARAVEAASQILDGLAHAHGRGIVHRDIKPTNVLLADEDGVSVRLLDFGLAQFDEADTLTAVGDVPGTLAYISPERLRGAPAEPASDVWAVGILLWEALAGRHPFWGVPLPQMASAIEAGAPPLRPERPDLPARLHTAVARALAHDPAQRPSASALAAELRQAWEERRRRSKPARPSFRIPRLSLPAPPRLRPEGFLPPVLGAAAVLAGGLMLPFYPSGWPYALAALVAALTLVSPRLALGLALFVPVLPLGNVALGAALLYAAVAAGWLALQWRDARHGLLFLVGPLLLPLGLLPLLPLAVQRARGPVRRAAHVVAGVAAASLAAGLGGHELPFGGGLAEPLGLAEEESTTAVASTLADALPLSLVLATLVLAAVAAAIPFVRGLWPVAGLGAAMLAGLLLLAPEAPALPLVAAAWVTCACLVLPRFTPARAQ